MEPNRSRPSARASTPSLRGVSVLLYRMRAQTGELELTVSLGLGSMLREPCPAKTNLRAKNWALKSWEMLVCPENVNVALGMKNTPAVLVALLPPI